MPSGESRLTKEVLFELGLRNRKVLVDSVEGIPGTSEERP